MDGLPESPSADSKKKGHPKVPFHALLLRHSGPGAVHSVDLAICVPAHVSEPATGAVGLCKVPDSGSARS
jgi:hypothetical protein